MSLSRIAAGTGERTKPQHAAARGSGWQGAQRLWQLRAAAGSGQGSLGRHAMRARHRAGVHGWRRSFIGPPVSFPPYSAPVHAPALDNKGGITIHGTQSSFWAYTPILKLMHLSCRAAAELCKPQAEPAGKLRVYTGSSMSEALPERAPDFCNRKDGSMQHLHLDLSMWLKGMAQAASRLTER